MLQVALISSWLYQNYPPIYQPSKHEHKIKMDILSEILKNLQEKSHTNAYNGTLNLYMNQLKLAASEAKL